jgi:hypothetical protein
MNTHMKDASMSVSHQFEGYIDGDDEDTQYLSRPKPAKYERYDSNSFLKQSTQVRRASTSQLSLKKKATQEKKSQIRQSNYCTQKQKRDLVSKSNGRVSRYKKKDEMKLSNSAYKDHNQYTTKIPQSLTSAKRLKFESKDKNCKRKQNHVSRESDKPLNFRSIDRTAQSNRHLLSTSSRILATDSGWKKKANKQSKAMKLRKNHISYLLRWNPLKYRITAFAQKVAAQRIQRHFRKYIERKKRNQKVSFEIGIFKLRKTFAKWVIKNTVTRYLIKKAEMKSLLNMHRQLNLEKISFIQRKIRSLKSPSPKFSIKRFKELLFAFVMGWKERRILAHLKSLPGIKETVDFVRLRNDFKLEQEEDLFLQKIKEKCPEFIESFKQKYFELIEAHVWIHKPAKEKYLEKMSKYKTKSRKNVIISVTNCS